MTETEYKPNSSQQPPAQNFTPKINLSSGILLALGSMTGAGIYVLIGSVERITGPAILVTFCLDLVIALLIACCYGECAAVFPTSGGGFVYVKEAFGEKALLVGWIVWLSNMAYGAICAITVGIFVADLVGYDADWFIYVMGVLSVVSFSYFNARGSETLSKVQNPIVFALLGTLVIGAIYLFMQPPLGSVVPFLPNGFYSIFTGAALFLDLFIGFEDMCSISEEIHDSKRNVPKILVYSLIMIGGFFFLVMLAIIYAVPQDTIVSSDIAFLDAVRGNEVVYFIVFLGAIFSLLTSVGVAVMASSRNLYALAKFDFIDRKWGEINAKYNVPMRAVVLSAFMCMLILVSGKVEFIASISNISYIISVVCVALTILKFRKTKTYSKDTFRIPFYPYSVYLTVFLCGLLILFIGTDSLLVAIAWFMIGIVIYLFFSSKNRVMGTFFLVLAFFIALNYILVGIILLIVGILFYLFRIANINSKILTLAGMKVFNLAFLWLLWEWSVSVIGSSPLYYMIPISFGIAILSIIFDVIPLREIMHYIELKKKDRNVPMAGIVLFSTDKTRFMDRFNTILYYTVMGISIFLFLDFVLILTQTIQFIPIDILSGYMSEEFLNFLFAGILLLSSLTLFMSAYYGYLLNKASHKIDKI